MNRTDLADPQNGILASFAGHHPLAVFERGASGENARFELQAEDQGPAIEFGNGTPLGTWTVTAQRLSGRLLGGDGSSTQIDAIGASCGGNLASSEAGGGAQRDPAVMRRNIVICFEDASVLAIVSAKTDREREHDSEQIAAVLTDPSGETETFGRPLLSTEYDSNGRQRRATLEFWPDPEQNGQPLRGAGTVVAATELELPGAHSTLAFFEWSVDGRPGIGRYEIIRAS